MIRDCWTLRSSTVPGVGEGGVGIDRSLASYAIETLNEAAAC